MKQKTNTLISRAAAMLLMVMLTTATAWAGEYTATYQAKINHINSGLYNIILERSGNSSLKATIADKSSAWQGNTGVRVDDEYYVTFKPSQNLYVATNPGTTTAIGFNMSSGTTITASVASNSSYYIKQVRLLDNGIQKATSATTAPNSRSATVTVSGDIQFNYIEVTLTDDYYGTITPQNGLTVGTDASLTYGNTSYYKYGTEITMNAPANHIIDEATGVSGASIAANKRSYTFAMPKQNVTPGATMSEVHTISCPSGLTVTSTPYCTDNTTNYYKKGETYTLTVDDANKVIKSLSASGASGSSVAANKRSATVTIGTSNVTVSATLMALSGNSNGVIWSLSDTDSNGTYDRLTLSGSGTLSTSLWDTDFAASISRVDVSSADINISGNPFSALGNSVVIVVPTLAYAGNYVNAAFASQLRTAFGHKHFGVTKDATNTAVYAIATAADLRNLAAAVYAGNDGSSKTFLQTADIDLGGSSSPFMPIGYNRYFKGTYDGGSHTVSGLYIYAGDYSCVGLFGKVQNGTVRNVILISPDVTNTYNQSYDICVGALIGYAEGATVGNCLVVSPTVNATGSGTKYFGALIGQTGNSTRVTNCSFYAGTGNASTGIGNRLTTIGDVSRAYQVTLGSNVGLPNPPATGGFIVQGSHYYAQGATAQLSYTGSIPNGYRVVYIVSPDNTGATVTQQVVLTMGSADITITASLSSTPLINISTGTIADIADQDYTGSAIVPDITLTVGGRKLTEGTDYLVSCTNNVNLGTATLTATGTGDYTGTLTKDFRICYTDKTGSCGANVTYTLHDEDQNGHYEQLTISGTGAMTDYAISDNVPWAAKCDDINSVTVQSGVTRIGARAFYDCKYLTSVSLPEGLTSIGDRAFDRCLSLPALTVPASVESVGNYAFNLLAYNISGCTLTFASGSRLTSVGDRAFEYVKASVDMSACTSLTSVPKAFIYFDGTVTFPRSLTSIAEHCFDYCKSTTKVYIDVPDNYLLTVKGTSVSATDGKADITSNIGVGTAHSEVTLSCIPNPADFVDNGDGSYTIHTATGWNIFCGILNDYPKGYFTGKTVRLGDNITVSRMAGSSNHDFTGTFDGNKMTLTVNYGTADSPITENYAAPFRNVTTTKADPNDAADTPAAIRNLKVNGSIYTSAKYAAGIVANQYGTVNISNCSVSVRIHSSHSGDGTHGGLVANQHNALTVEGCLFEGRLLTTNATTDCGGLVGYHSGGTCTISNCLYAPNADYTPAEGESYINSGATFCRNYDGTPVNCYYTATLGDAQGKARRSITAGEGVTISNIALTGSSQNYDVSGIRAYDNGGINYNNTLYYGSGDQVSLTLASSGYQSSGFLASAGTLSGSDNPYTLTMPDEDVTVSVSSLAVIDWAEVNEGTKDDPYIIYNKDQLDLLANRVNGINGETRQDNGYQNKYFELGADITYSHSADANLAEYESNYTAIGGYFDSRYRSFKGHFDGKGHTISGIRIYKGGNSDSDTRQGLFSETDHATIRGIILADVRITGDDHTGGIVGYNGNFSSVSDCHVAADVAIHAVQSDAYHHGGIVGTNSAYCTVSDCTSAATLTTTSGSVRNYSGIAGSNSGTLRHNLAIGAVVPATKNNSYGAICGNGGGTLENNYYHACRVASDDVTATNVGCGNISDGNGGYTTDDVTANDGAVPTLRDDADNSTALGLLAALATAGPNGTPLNLGWGAGKYPMQLAGRTLYKDGAWNTLVLPFAIDDFDGTPLEGATVKELNATTSNLNNGTLTLNFSDNLTAIEAGTPYIVKWTKPDGYDEADPETRDVKNPVFTGVTVSSTTPTPVTSNDNSVTFVGQYSPFTIDDSNINSVIMLGAKNTLGYSKNPRQLHSFRAHFEVPTSANVREFILDFGDDETRISSLTTDPSPRGEGSEYYTLDGRKLDGKPTKKGMYIVNGRKVVIK